ncbi:hypothetical protein WMY93_000027 [Mugilogobius chulae]|uniref:Uncharacterized protein n=1 Tax=Mugilogobius chulae TaxID=88201 RepID=A0AAW0QD42_9GOBI
MVIYVNMIILHNFVQQRASFTDAATQLKLKVIIVEKGGCSEQLIRKNNPALDQIRSCSGPDYTEDGVYGEAKKESTIFPESHELQVLKEEEHPLLSLCRSLVQREEQMMTEEGLSEDQQTQLHLDLKQLWSQIQEEIGKSFSRT